MLCLVQLLTACADLCIKDQYSCYKYYAESLGIVKCNKLKVNQAQQNLVFFVELFFTLIPN